MRIVPDAQQRVPGTALDLTPARAAFEEVLTFVGSEVGQRMMHSDMERELKHRGRDALRRLYQCWLDQLAPGQAQEPVVDAEGHPRRPRPGLHTRKLLTLFGPVVVRRTGYGAEGKTSLHPLDAQLNLPPEKHSHELRRCVAREASRGSFEEAMATIQEYTDTAIGKRQVETLARRAAQDFDAFYARRRQEGAGVDQETGSLLVITSDAKGVPVYTCDLRPQTRAKAEQQPRKLTTRLTKGEKPHRKRMAVVTSVYTVAPYRRTPEEVFADLSRQPVRDDRPPRPRPEHKRVAASLVETPQQMLEEAFREALCRDPNHHKTWVAVVDGNQTQLDLLKKLARKLARQHKTKLTIILDIIHVLEYIWKAAHVFHDEGSDDLEHWVLERLARVLHGHAGQVAGGMRRSATRRGLSQEESAPVESCAKYLLNHKRYLNYPQYLAAR